MNIQQCSNCGATASISEYFDKNCCPNCNRRTMEIIKPDDQLIMELEMCSPYTLMGMSVADYEDDLRRRET